MIAATGLMVAAPAAGSLSQCTSDDTCIWANNDFAGTFANKATGAGNYANVPANINNAMDSWANRSSVNTSCGADGANGTADKQTWARVSNDNNVSPFSSDEVSSWRTKFGC